MSAAVLPLGPIRVHVEVGLVALMIGVVVDPPVGLAFAIVVLLHELGHAMVAALWPAADGDLRVRLQLGSGTAYLPRVPAPLRDAAVLLGGAAIGLAVQLSLAFALDQGPHGFWRAVGDGLAGIGWSWTLYQISPAPTADGGALLRRIWARRFGRRRVGFGCWVAFALLAGGVLAIRPDLLEPVVWLVGLALLLARSESAHLAAAEVYDAFEAGQLDEAVRRAERAVARLPRAERARVAEIGVHAGIERGRAEAVLVLARELPAGSLLWLEAIRWLLARDVDGAAVEAERLHDGVDADRVRLDDDEAYAELCLAHAAFEAGHLRPESALGLLERAVDKGFDHRDRIHAEGAFTRLREHPRYARALARLPDL